MILSKKFLDIKKKILLLLRKFGGYLKGKKSVFCLGDYESLWFQDRLCVPDVTEIRDTILREAHATPYPIHPGSTKMYMDLKELF